MRLIRRDDKLVILAGAAGMGIVLVALGASAWWQARQMQPVAGLGVIGIAALGAWLLVYRRMRDRLRLLGLIGRSLKAMGEGEQSVTALALSDSFGAEAAVWNQLLQEREAHRRESLAQQAQAQVEARQTATSHVKLGIDAHWQGIVIVDERLHVLYSNGAAATFLQTSLDELIERDLNQAPVDPQVLDKVREAFEARTPNRQTVEVKRDEVVLRFSIRPIPLEEGQGMMIVIDDVTQQRLAQQATSHFVAHATHELRTPLTNMMLYLEMALNEGEHDAQVRGQSLNVVMHECQRLNGMVSDMLSVSQIEAGAMNLARDDVRLDALFDTLQKDFLAKAQDQSITLAFDLPPKLPVIQGDREKLVLVFQNLLGNALKYTPQGGSVDFAADVAPHCLTVEVRDSGIGIGDQDIGRIFDKFYRAQDARVAKITGTGLGLALTREIVRMHGGDLTVTSELDQGSTFTVTLPIAVEAV